MAVWIWSRKLLCRSTNEGYAPHRCGCRLLRAAFVIEIKIWHGEEYNRRGEAQLAEYLESYHLNKSYLLSFNLNKNKEVGIKTIQCNGKIITEVVV